MADIARLLAQKTGHLLNNGLLIGQKYYLWRRVGWLVSKLSLDTQLGLSAPSGKYSRKLPYGEEFWVNLLFGG
jgi:hypothetical protein